MSSDLELCLFRHGRTVWNAQGKYQGQADVELDELGRRQALKVGERAGAMGAAAVYTSDLQRCVHTAQPIFERSGLEAETDLRLRERDVGTWSGHTREEISAQYPDQYAAWIAGDDVSPGGGETSAQMLTRMVSFLDDVIARHSGGTVIAVTHGGWIKAASQWVLTKKIERIGLGVVSQASLTVFSYSGGSWRLEAYNDRGHLVDIEPVDQELPAVPVY